MHYRYLVTFNKGEAANSEDARRRVENTLCNEGFLYSDGRWGSGMADWFVIGGRWSGELSRHSWAKDITVRMRAIEKQLGVQVWGVWYGDKKKEEYQRRLAGQFQQMWDKASPEQYRGIPIQRDTSKEEGYEDDAMILTQDIYDDLLEEFEGSEDSENHADLDFEAVSPDMVGRKWIVVVDYYI